MRAPTVAESVKPTLASQYRTTVNTPSNSHSFKPKTWQIVSLIVALGAGIAYYMYRRSNKPSITTATSQSPNKSANKQQAAALKAIQSRLDTIKQSIEQMTNTGEVIDIEPWRSEIAQLINHAASQTASQTITQLSMYEADYQLHVVKLFATYHTLRNLMVAHSYDPADEESTKRLKEWEGEQERDLTAALSLLESVNQDALSALFAEQPADPSSEQPHPYAATHLLALELAQRLKDMTKLQATYQALLRGPASSGAELADRIQEELLALFMTAPMVGAWSDFKRFGDELVRRNGAEILDSFHQAAVQDAIYPDYKLLLEKAQSFQSKQSQTSAQSMMWAKFDVTEMVLTHDRSFSPNPMLNEQLQALAAQGKEPKRIVPEPHTMPLQVTGAIARMQSPFIVQLPCVGLFNEASFSLYASAKVTGDPTTGNEGEGQPASLCDIEMVCKKTSSSQQGKERSYEGSFIVRDFMLDSQGKRGPMSVEHVFDLEITIRRED